MNTLTEVEAKMHPAMCVPNSYVLMTAAYNEGVHIERTIQSVLSQTVLPDKWVIVSDGSTDQTDEIVRRYAKEHEFICFLRMDRSPGHSFRSKVIALQAGYKLLQELDFAFIGNLDGDISVEATYFENLMDRFQRNPNLGLGSGFVCEDVSGEFKSRKTNRTHAVPHAAQLVRRECYRDIGGYQVFEYGGEDWHAQTSARMHGWQAQSFPELPVFHHRRTNTSSNLLRACFRMGRLDYSFGSDPFFEFFKCCLRMSAPPFAVGGVLRFAGFVWSYIRRDQRPVSEKFVKFLRSEQKGRLAGIFHPGQQH